MVDASKVLDAVLVYVLVNVLEVVQLAELLLLILIGQISAPVVDSVHKLFGSVRVQFKLGLFFLELYVVEPRYEIFSNLSGVHVRM